MSGLDPNGGGALVVPGGGASLSDATPAALGTAAAGVATSASRADHVHEAPAGGTTHTSGTLAARPASPAAGDTYEITSGAGMGDRYACYVAAAWTLVSAAPYAAIESTCRIAIDFSEASGSTNVANTGAAGGYLVKAGSPTIAAYPWLGGRGMTCPTSSAYYQSDATGLLDAEILGSAWTLEAWVSGGTGSGVQTILHRRCDTATWGAVPGAADLCISGTTFRPWMGTMVGNYWTTAGSVPTTGIHHVVMAWSQAGNAMLAYVDGSLVSTTATSGAIATNTSGRWGCGQLAQGGSAISEPFAGHTHMLRVHNNMLSATEVQERWARGANLYRGL